MGRKKCFLHGELQFSIAADAEQLAIDDICIDPRGHQTVELELCHHCLLDVPDIAANASELANELKCNSIRTTHFDFPPIGSC